MGFFGEVLGKSFVRKVLVGFSQLAGCFGFELSLIHQTH